MRETVRAALEVDALPPLGVEVLSEASAGGCLAQRLRLRLTDRESGEAFLILPPRAETGRCPAVVLFHDHGSEFRIGKEKLIEPWDDAEAAALHRDWADRFYGGRSLGSMLVQRGYAVLCADALGWGSRMGNGYEAQQALAANLMQVGTSPAAVVARDDCQLVAWLAADPRIDAGRIGVAGFSFGAFRAWQTAALCEAVAASLAANWMSTLSALLQPGNNLLRGQSAFYMLHPPLAGRLDFPDLASLIAPRPACFQAGRSDRHFPMTGVENAFSHLESAWTRAGAPAHLTTQIHDAAHAFSGKQQDAALDWLDRVLQASGT